MTTSAAIAPGANSFTSSLGHSGRLSSSGKTSDLTTGLLTPDDNSSSSADSDSGDGSTFHSVLNQLYSSQDGNGSSSASEPNKTSTKVADKGKPASTTTSASSVLPLNLDGAPLRGKSQVLGTLTTTTSAINVPPSPSKALDKDNTQTSSTTTDTGEQLAALPPSTYVPPSTLSEPPPDDKVRTEAKQTSDIEPAATQSSVQTPVQPPPGVTIPSTDPKQPLTNSTTTLIAPRSVAPQDNPVSKPSEPVVSSDTVPAPPSNAQPSKIVPVNPSKSLSLEETSSSGAESPIPAKPGQTGETKPVAASESSPTQPEKPTIQSIPAADKPVETPTTDTASQATQGETSKGPVNTRQSNDRRVLTQTRSAATAPQEQPSKLLQQTPLLKPTEPVATTVPIAQSHSTPVDGQSFQSVLNQVVSSQTPETQPDQTQPEQPQLAQDQSSNDLPQSQVDTAVNQVAVNQINVPQPLAQTKSAKTRPVSPADPSDPTPVTTAPNQFAAIATPVEQGEPAAPATTFNSSKPSDSSNQPRANDIIPTFETSTTPTEPAPSGELAFAARLTPVANNSESTAGPNGDDSKPRTTPPSPKQVDSDQVAADPQPPVDRTHAAPATTQAVKAEVNLSEPQPVAPPPQLPATHTVTTPAPSNPSPAARMEQAIETPAAPQTTPRDITVRVPDSTDRGTDVRFVERGGEIHVSVRTTDTEVAQTLRGGLSDFVGRMEHTGIRAEVWRPGQDAAASQNQSQQQQPFDRDQRGDSRGSGSGRDQHGSAEQENRQGAEKPGWVEELETSLAQSGQVVQ